VWLGALAGAATLAACGGSAPDETAAREVGGEPEGVTTSTDGRFVYVTSEEDNSISVIETAANTMIKAVRGRGTTP
jgi:YVTN family beta-propeller protein